MTTTASRKHAGQIPPAPMMDRPSDWDAYRPFPNMPGRNDRQGSVEIPMLVRAFRLPKSARLLEMGCGRGVALPVWHRLLRPSRVAGIDIDELALAEAAERVGAAGFHAELFQGDVRRMPFDDGSFDIIVDFGTCYHISYPEIALHEAARLLAPDGVFIEETRVSQLLSHPIRSSGRALPWKRVSTLRRDRWRILWASFVKTAGSRT